MFDGKLEVRKASDHSLVGILSRFMQKPCEGHWFAAKRVLRNFDGDKEKLGYHFKICYESWIRSCLLEITQTISSSRFHTEREYVANSLRQTKEIVWLRKFLKILPGKTIQSTPTHDLTITFGIKLAKNPKFHDRTKHINTKYHLIRHHVEAITIHLHHCSTNEKIADIFTKALGREKLERFRTMLGLTNIPSD
eukprot:PITA_19650